MGTFRTLPWIFAGAGLLLAAAIRSFDVPVPLETVSETTANVSIGDLNGDGIPDLVLAKGRHWPLADVVMFGDGKGHFKPGPALPNRPDRSYSAPLADLDGDGDLDIVLSNDRPDPKIILLNDGKGRFTLGGTFGDPQWPTRNVVLADLNGDKFPDIAVANRPGPAYVCFNDGKAHFQCKPFAPETSSTILAADMNGDGFVDLIVGCRDSCQSVVYFNDGKGNFPHKQPFGPPRSSTRAMAIADFDGDGRLDIAACHEESGLYVYFNQGGGRFADSVKIAGKEALPYSMLARDLTATASPRSSSDTYMLLARFISMMATGAGSHALFSATVAALSMAWLPQTSMATASPTSSPLALTPPASSSSAALSENRGVVYWGSGTLGFV